VGKHDNTRMGSRSWWTSSARQLRFIRTRQAMSCMRIIVWAHVLWRGTGGTMMTFRKFHTLADVFDDLRCVLKLVQV